MSDIVYGRNPVYESLRAKRRQFHKLILAEGIRQGDTIKQILSLANQAGVPMEWADRDTLDGLVHANHQGVLLRASGYPYVGLYDILDAAGEREEAPLVLLLDLLKDPQNVGTLIRTAEAVGVSGVVIQERRAVGITASVVSASSGAVEHLWVAQVTNLANTLSALKEEGLWIAGLEAVEDAQIYHKADLTGPLGVVVGSEGRGMRRLVRERCDFLIELPMRGRVASLNASVAGSVALYEILRQRQVKADR